MQQTFFQSQKRCVRKKNSPLKNSINKMFENLIANRIIGMETSRTTVIFFRFDKRKILNVKANF